VQHLGQLQRQLRHRAPRGFDASQRELVREPASVRRAWLSPAFPQHQRVAGKRSRLAVKRQLEPLGQQRLEHRHEFAIPGRTGRSSLDIVASLIQPLRPSQDVGFLTPYAPRTQRLSVTLRALIRPLLW